MNSPAVFLHKDQLMQVEQETVETVLALQQGKIALVELENAEHAPAPAPEQEQAQAEEKAQEQEQATKTETKKGKRKTT